MEVKAVCVVPIVNERKATVQNMTTDLKTKLRLAVDAAVYCCLLLLSYYLVNGVFLEYQEFKTKFSVTKEPVTIEDNPAILVKFVKCGELIYGVNYNITVQTRESASSGYDKDPNDIVVYTDRDKQFNINRTSGKNYIEVRKLETLLPDIQLLLISPFKTSLIQKGQFYNKIKMFDFTFSYEELVGNRAMLVGFTSMVRLHYF